MAFLGVLILGPKTGGGGPNKQGGGRGEGVVGHFDKIKWKGLFVNEIQF